MKKKILFANGHMNTGGVEKSLLSVLSHIDYDKYDVDIVLFEGIGDYKDQIPNEVNIIEIDLKKTEGSFLRCAKDALVNKDWYVLKYRIANVISKYTKQPMWLKLAKRGLGLTAKYDCAIAYRFGFPMNYVAYLVDADKKLVWWHHGEYTYSQKQTKTLNEILKNFDKVIFVSDCCRKFCIKNGLMCSNKSIIIPNIIDDKLIGRLAAERNPYENIDGKIIVTVSRLSPEKHIENAIAAAKILKSRYGLNFKWYIIGNGVLYEELDARIKANSLENIVFLLGNRVNPYPYIVNADLYVHTSYVESQGIAVLEAMTLGIPCVVTNSFGIQEFVVDRKNAVVAEQDVVALVDCIKNVLYDGCLSDNIVSNGLKTIDRYSSEAILDKLIDVID